MTFDELKKRYHFFKGIKFDCGEGWAQILDNMASALTFFFNTIPNCEFQILQVKEKFGTLRVYYIVSDELREEVKYIIHSIITLAEDQSKYVCERCGDYGQVRPECDAHTYCDDCFERYRFESGSEDED